MYPLCRYFSIEERGNTMRSEIQKWGNSLAIRIPKAFAKELGVDHKSGVDITVADGQLVVSPLGAPPYNLEQLLQGVTEENLHSEVDTGSVAGGEAW